MEHFDQAVHAFNIYRGDPVAHFDQAIAASPGFAMPVVGKAALYVLATEPVATEAAKGLLDGLDAGRLDARTASFAGAVRLLADGQWRQGAIALDHHTMRYPRDLLALQVGHLTDFMHANARNLRDRIARALPQWSPDVPGRSFVLGMHAFGLEESGDYARAEAVGREACEVEPLDCWAHHAVAHVFEMQGRPEEGVAWMAAREPYWDGDDNFFKVHNWWHRALYHLDLGEPEKALALYDGHVGVAAGPGAMALDLIDASAMLWRLALSGVDVGGRFATVASAWDAHADGRLYPFNDWHAVMAYLGAGRMAEVDRIIQGYRGLDREMREADGWAKVTGLPLIEGFSAFWQGRYPEAAEKLHGARYIANSFGGSHAQRDVIDWTMTEAAIRGGLGDHAAAFAAERVAMKPHSPIARRFARQAHDEAKAPRRAA